MIHQAISLQHTASERRQGERYITVLQLGVLRCADQVQLCLIVNISQGGMKIRVYGEVPDVDTVSVQLRGGETVNGRIAWRESEVIGVSFVEELQSERLLALLQPAGQGARAPRLDVELALSVRSEAVILRAVLRNISPAGARLEFPACQPAGRNVQINLPKIGAVDCQVRWRAGNEVGVSFNRPLLLKDLSQAIGPQALGA